MVTNMKKLLISIVYKCKKGVLLIASLSIISTILSVLIPYINGVFLDLLSFTENANSLRGIVFFLGVASVAHIIIAYCLSVVSIKVKLKYHYELMIILLQHLRKISALKIKNYNSAYLNQRIHQDSLEITTFLLENFISIFTVALQIISAYYVVMRINQNIAWVLLIFIPIQFVIFLLYKDKIYLRSLQNKETSNASFNAFNDQIENMEYYKIDMNFRMYDKKLHKQISEYYKSSIRLTSTSSAYTQFSNFFMVLTQMIILYITGMMVLERTVSIGELTAVNSYFLLIQNGIKYYMTLIKKHQSFRASCKRMEELMQLDEEENGTIVIHDIKSILIKMNKLPYKNLDVPVDIEVRKGDIIKIIGQNGAGKTSFAKMLIGMYNSDDKENNIMFNEINICDVDVYALRLQQIAYIPQTMFKSDVKVKELFQDELANLDITQNDMEYLKVHWEMRTDMLSGGQLKKITILSKVLPNKRMIIFDEPLAYLDQASMVWFYDYIKQIANDRIIFVISHDNMSEDIYTKIVEIN